MRLFPVVPPLLQTIFKWTARVLLSVLVCLLILAGLVLVPQTRVALLEQVLSRLGGDVQIRIANMRSPSLGRWHIAHIELAWRNEPWIEGRNLYLEFQPRDLLDKKITIAELSAEYLGWTQPSAGFASAEKKPEPQAGKLPDWSVQVDSLAINKLELDLSALDLPPGAQQSAFNVEASAQWLQTTATPFKLNLQVQGLDNSLQAAVRTDIDKENTLGIQAEINEQKGGVLAALIHLPAEQALNLDFVAHVKNSDTGYDLQIEQAHTQIYDTTLGLRAQLYATRDFSQLEIASATISTGQQEHQLAGRVTREELDIAVNLQQFPLQIITPWVADLQEGFLSAEAQISGPWAKPAIHGSVQGELAGTHRNWSPHLQFSSELGFDWQQLEVQGLDIKDLNGSVASAKASGLWQLQEGTLNVALDAQGVEQDFLNYLRSYIPQIPVELQIHNIAYLKGKLNGNVKNQLQNASLELQTRIAGSYREDTFTAATIATGTGRVFDIQKLSVNVGEARLDAQGRLDLITARNNLKVEVRALPLALLAKQGLPLPETLRGSVDGNAHLHNSFRDMEVEFGVDSALTYVLPTPENDRVREKMQLTANGSWQKKLLKLNELNLQLIPRNADPISILTAQADIALAEKNLAISASTRNFPASLITHYGWPDAKGLINVDLQVNTALTDIVSERGLEQLAVEGHLRYQTEQIDRKTGKPITLEIDMDLSNEQDADSKKSWWLAQLSMNRGEESSRSLQLRTQSESIIKFIEDRSQLPRTELKGELDFSFFNFLLPKSRHVAGLLRSDIWIDGELTRPAIQGEVNLAEGTVVDERYGIRLHNIRAQTQFSGQQMKLDLLTANDSGKGSLEGSGFVDWQPAKENGELAFDLLVKNFEMIRHRQIEGKVDAELKLHGDLKRVLLEGDIELTPFSVSIAQSTTADVPKLNYEFREEEGAEAEAEQRYLPELALDLRINVDKQAYIRGRGLEAELAGTVALVGPVNDLAYKGEFETIRGQFNVMGKRFLLDKGDVRFSNNALAIYVRGLYEEQEFKVTAELRGTNDKLDVKLSSEPALPEDELLARLIFGRSVQEMTPLQALQLAQAVQTLRGGGGFDPVEKAREALNVDTIKLDTDETEEGKTVSLGAGKYISDKVYLELERSSDPIYPWQGKVTIELTPHINLESSTGGSTGSFAEILWKYDY